MKANVQRVFTPNPIKNLEDEDFELSGAIKIMLKLKDCLIVLFYADNLESNNLADVWQSVGQQGIGNVFAACNLRINPKISTAFNELNMLNSSLHWAALKTVPFILVYQNGFPIGFYNGDRSVQSILDFSLTLACRSDYREYTNLFGGIQSEDNIGIKGIDQYGSTENPFRKESLEYVSNKPVRNYPLQDKAVSATASENEFLQKEEPKIEEKSLEVPSGTRVTPEEVKKGGESGENPFSL